MKTIVFEHPDWEDGNVTFPKLVSFMMEHRISFEKANIRYAGCGSHQIEFVFPMNEQEKQEAIEQERKEREEDERFAAYQRSQGLIA